MEGEKLAAEEAIRTGLYGVWDLGKSDQPAWSCLTIFFVLQVMVRCFFDNLYNRLVFLKFYHTWTLFGGFSFAVDTVSG